MRKIFAAATVMGMIFGVVLNGFPAELKTGSKAADFFLKDSAGKTYSLSAPEFAGKVLSIFYVDPDAKDLNHLAEEVLLKDAVLVGHAHYKGFSISNLKATKIPLFLVKSAIKDKQHKTGILILLDNDYTILRLWGLKNHTSSLVILDKEGICRYVHNGKLSRAHVENVRKMINEYLIK